MERLKIDKTVFCHRLGSLEPVDINDFIGILEKIKSVGGEYVEIEPQSDFDSCDCDWMVIRGKRLEEESDASYQKRKQRNEELIIRQAQLMEKTERDYLKKLKEKYEKV